MAFRMKTIAQLLGIDEQLSVFGRPVFVKDLEGGVKAEANRDGTTFIDKDIPKNEIKEAIDVCQSNYDPKKYPELSKQQYNELCVCYID